MPLPTSEIFAFSEPKIKGGEISVAVNLGAQVLHVLHATRSVWRGLYEHLHREFSHLPAPAPLPRARPGKMLDPARRAIYLRIVEEHRRGQHASWTAACRAHGINAASFGNWYSRHRHELGAAPVLKPGGRIL